MKVYKVTFRRILSYFVWPFFGLLLILGFSYYRTPDLSILNDKVWITVVFMLFLFWTIPVAILLINHYTYLKATTLEFDEAQDEFHYSQINQSLKFKKSDIIEI